MKSKDLTIIIVTFKSEEKILNCLKEIKSEIPVIVIENSSNQNFKKMVEEKFKNVKCILTGGNKGYAVANNIGLRLVKTKFSLVLNPDAILNSQSIDNFLITANKVKDFWLIGPATGQIVNFDFSKDNLKEVDNIKGFAIFLICLNLIKIFLMKIISFILKKLIFVEKLKKIKEKFT